MPYHQMLVACRDVQIDIGETINNKVAQIAEEISTLTDNAVNSSNLDVYTVTADLTYLNGIPFTGERADALDAIKTSGKNIIVAHYDTLSEGIDIDSISGVLLMREMTKSKLIQTIGRASRPFKDDMDHNYAPRKDLFNLFAGVDYRKKQRSIITFPVIDGKWITGKSSKDVARAFIAGGYGDLLDYMPKAEYKPTGKSTTGRHPWDEPTFTSAVIDSKVDTYFENLKELFQVV
jgi:hypothetical protein